jgi:putative FmdB family regulatory protein
MPIYTFCCPFCGDVVEKIKKMDEDRKHEKCESCGKYMEIQPSLCSFHLKGGGWYVTDYKSKPSGGKTE